MPPTKIVVVDPNSGSRDTLAKALMEAGYAVAVAPSGSFAVTMLEWERPDLVISTADIQDMDSCELLTLMRDDPTTMATPFLLLAGHNRSLALAATEAGADRVIIGDIAAAEVVTEVRALAQRRSDRGGSPRGDLGETGEGETGEGEIGERVSDESLVAELEAAAHRVSAEPAESPRQVSPSPMDPAAVIRAIARSGKTGCLFASVTGDNGVVLFERGHIVHASFRRQTGETAFAALMAASCGTAGARFWFNRGGDALLTHLPRTISHSVEELLVSVAVTSDAAAASPAQAVGPAAPPRRWQ